MDIIDYSTHFVTTYPFGAISLAILVGMLIAFLVPHRERGASPMTKKERDTLVKARIAARVTDALEEAWLADEITVVERENWYRKFSGMFNLPDLKPPKSKDEHKALKEQIWARLCNWRLYTPMPFPDRKLNLSEKIKQVKRSLTSVH